MTFKEILSKLNNRYVYATLAFLVVFLFIDQFNLFEQIKLHRSLKDQKGKSTTTNRKSSTANNTSMTCKTTLPPWRKWPVNNI